MQITKNFNLEEFVKTPVIINSLTPTQIVNICRLAFELQRFRDALDKPIQINSGFRTKAHNKAVGGVANSQHLTGSAVDLELNSAEQKKLKLNETWAGGYGSGKTFCHLDLGKKRRWTY